MDNDFLPNDIPHRVYNIRKIKKFFSFIVVFIFFFYFFFLLVLSAPADFPIGTIIKIEPGMNLRSVSLELKQEHVIRSRLAFEALVIMYGGEKHIISTDYYFENKLPVYEVARRIAIGEHHLAPIAVTIPEGFDVHQIGDTFVSKLANFNESKFLTEAKDLEGNLFPDTYFFLINDTEREVIKSMNGNFEKKMSLLRPDIVASGKKERDIIIMASLIEREAKGDVDRGFISGILWKRLSLDMPLQVDSALETYKTIGLPKDPIDNPGLAAILASIHPQSSPYLYYLHDKNGNVHYATSYALHLQNVLKYLK